jgi:hypothetical protein
MTLPASAQARLDALRTEGAPAGDPPPSSETPPATPPVAGNGESVTISRDEFNELQAAAGRVRAAEGKAESVQMDVEALQARLTALETAGKGSGKGEETPPATTETDDDWQPSQVQFTDKENEDYGESREFVVKVVLDTLNKVLPKVFGSVKNLKTALAETKQLAEGTVRNVERVEGADFTNKVREKVGNFDEVVNHQHWRAFAEAADPKDEMGQRTYADTIRMAVQARKLEVMERVFNDFKTKYGLTGRPTTTGYEGGASGNGSRLPETNSEPEMLPLSKRKEAHRKWINKEISDSEYQRVYDQYAAADKEGRVDYNA